MSPSMLKTWIIKMAKTSTDILKLNSKREQQRMKVSGKCKSQTFLKFKTTC